MFFFHSKVFLTYFSSKSFKTSLKTYFKFLEINSRQSIIGLHRYDSNLPLLGQLFYFTFLVVITAIQLLIFQEKYTKQFMWTSQIESTPNTRSSAEDNDEKTPSKEQQNTETAKKTFIEKVNHQS